MKNRYLLPFIQDELKEKMIFLGGPRQVGKTTLALSLIPTKDLNHAAYLNWDNPIVPRQLQNGILPAHQKLIILDEIHKFSRWRNLVKGLYDTNKDKTNFIVTGSARLDYYRKGGDSLLGRYFYYRLHPLSLLEINSKGSVSDVKDLLKFGGFPEPFFKQSETFLRKWQRQRQIGVVKEDLRDLEQIKMISDVELLAELLPSKVGSVLSIKSICEDLIKDHKTIEKWITALESLYYCYRIAPYGAVKIRAVKKEKKLYMWDWAQVQEPGFRFENMVASHLLKYCHFIEDTQGHAMELRYLRDTDKREVDFVVLQNKKPLFAVECKTGERNISPHVHYFKARTSIPQFYQVHLGSASYLKEGVRVLPFHEFCTEVGLL